MTVVTRTIDDFRSWPRGLPNPWMPLAVKTSR
jgi:hypothetical protein